jgi:hypothetical protein
MLDVNKNIKEIYRRKKIALIALSAEFAEEAKRLHRIAQGDNFFWDNQTFQAMDNVFGQLIDDGNIVGFLLAHGKDYGVYLELANNRQNESLRLIINELAPKYIAAVKEIYG